MSFIVTTATELFEFDERADAVEHFNKLSEMGETCHGPHEPPRLRLLRPRRSRIRHQCSRSQAETSRPSHRTGLERNRTLMDETLKKLVSTPISEADAEAINRADKLLQRVAITSARSAAIAATTALAVAMSATGRQTFHISELNATISIMQEEINAIYKEQE